MKVAILLTGNLRSWRICCHILKKSIIDHYNCDVFMSVDSKNNIQNFYKNSTNDTELSELNDAISFYKPKKVYYGTYDFTDEYTKLKEIKTIKVYETGTIDISLNNNIYSFSKPYDDTKNNKVVNSNFVYNHFKPLYAQYFNALKCYELMSTYSKENNITYDLVIRLRFDHLICDPKTIESINKFQMIGGQILYNDYNIELAKNIDNIKVHLSNPLNNSIYVVGMSSFNGYCIINDWFWITNADTAHIIWTFYEHLTDIIKECSITCYPYHGACIEHYFFKYLIKNNLTIRLSNIGGQVIRTIN